MRDKIDYLALERKNHNEGSFNSMVKNLVTAVRYIREKIPATDIQIHMPGVYELEDNLHSFDNSIGNPRREYVKEVWEILENEPEPDEAKSFAVCAVGIRNEHEVVFLATGHTFPQHIIAEEWIKDSGELGTQYAIIEIIERK